jgi:hypothetical protein
VRLLAEYQSDAMRLRVTDCSEPDTRFVFASTRADLWLLAGVSQAAELEDDVAFLLENAEHEGDTPAGVIDHAIAMLGRRWPALLSSEDAAVEQLLTFDRTPPWMLRVPAEDVWSVRRLVFGEDTTRVPRALYALRAAYKPDAPAAPTLRALWRGDRS